MLKQSDLPAQLPKIAGACTDHPKIANNSMLHDANGTTSVMPACLVALAAPPRKYLSYHLQPYWQHAQQHHRRC